jgi:hypothetical protein
MAVNARRLFPDGGQCSYARQELPQCLGTLIGYGRFLQSVDKNSNRFARLIDDVYAAGRQRERDRLFLITNHRNGQCLRGPTPGDGDLQDLVARGQVLCVDGGPWEELSFFSVADSKVHYVGEGIGYTEGTQRGRSGQRNALIGSGQEGAPAHLAIHAIDGRSLFAKPRKSGLNLVVSGANGAELPALPSGDLAQPPPIHGHNGVVRCPVDDLKNRTGWSH